MVKPAEPEAEKVWPEPIVKLPVIFMAGLLVLALTVKVPAPEVVKFPLTVSVPLFK